MATGPAPAFSLGAAGSAAGARPLFADRYAVERELGAGGMATVYLAEDARHGRKVAVKVLREELAASLAAERFLREIQIAAQLLHPHILTLFDSGTAAAHESGGPLLYYVMPYVEGESLRTRLAREGELPIDETVRLLRDVADALDHAHRRGIVHRDVKPENILLSGRHALVADFGIAKAVAAAQRDQGAGNRESGLVGDRPRLPISQPSLTSQGVVLGTPAYMAPEQAAGDAVDHRADLYALGVVAYEMLAGAPPFAGPTPQHVMAAHLTRAPERPSRTRASVPAALEQLVMRCLEKRPADRWQSAAEVLRQLDAVSAATTAAAGAAPRPREPVEHTFRLTEDVCRKLDRATLDPRIIGDVIHYLDNEVGSDVLLCVLHGAGHDQREFTPLLQVAPYRTVAPTLYGFEPSARRRIALGLGDHVTLVRELLRDLIRRLRPRVTVVGGFSSGGDLALQLVAAPPGEPPLRVDGVLSLGCNLSLETCFVTRLLARIGGDDSGAVLADLRSLAAGAGTLDEWLDVHEYLVAALRKFHDDVAPLRRFAADVVRPFAAGGESPFVEWYREASERVRCLRCVFEDTELNNRPLREIRLRNLDGRVLGPRYRDDSIVTEPRTNHFDLLKPECILRYVDEILESTGSSGRDPSRESTVVQ